jgi:hypothetical protein
MENSDRGIKENIKMNKYVILGASPCMEFPVKQEDNNYRNRALRECRAYIVAIRKKLGPEPEGATLRVKSFTLDFGTHYEVVCNYEEGNKIASEYALKCYSESPQKWEEVGMRTPGIGGSSRTL